MAAKTTYKERAARMKNPAGRLLLETMARKESNLCLSADVADATELLALISAAGPHVCCVKTHIDITTGTDDSRLAAWVAGQFPTDLALVQKRGFALLTGALAALAARDDFVLFEDRKFADIGRTVQLQYEGGPFAIAEWAHVTNAHVVPGEGIIDGLRAVAARFKAPRGLLLLAEMSSRGTLARGAYADTAYEWALRHSDFVFGFIGQRRLGPPDGPDFVYMTPGVQLGGSSGDGLGQQYRTPDQVVFDDGCDVIIVGRGIYGGVEVLGNGGHRMISEACARYRESGWAAYLRRLQS